MQRLDVFMLAGCSVLEGYNPCKLYAYFVLLLSIVCRGTAFVARGCSRRCRLSHVALKVT